MNSNAQQIVNSLLEAWTREDWRWVYDTAAAALRIIKEVQKDHDRLRQEHGPNGPRNVANQRLRAKNLPVRVQSDRFFNRMHRETKYDSDKSVGFYLLEAKTVFLRESVLDAKAANVIKPVEILAHELTHYLQHKKAGFKLHNTRSVYTDDPEEMMANSAGFAADDTYDHDENHRYRGSALMKMHGEYASNPKAAKRWFSTFARHFDDQAAMAKRSLGITRYHWDKIDRDPRRQSLYLAKPILPLP